MGIIDKIVEDCIRSISTQLAGQESLAAKLREELTKSLMKYAAGNCRITVLPENVSISNINSIVPNFLNFVRKLGNLEVVLSDDKIFKDFFEDRLAEAIYDLSINGVKIGRLGVRDKPVISVWYRGYVPGFRDGRDSYRMNPSNTQIRLECEQIPGFNIYRRIDSWGVPFP